MASKQWRIASFSLSICLSGGLGGCLSLTVLESRPSMTTVDPAPVADLDDSGVLEAPRRRQTGNGVDPIAVLAHRTHDRMGAAAVKTVERLPAFAAAPSTNEPKSAGSQRRIQAPRPQVSNAEIAKRDRQAEVLIRQSVRSICEGCQN